MPSSWTPGDPLPGTSAARGRVGGQTRESLFSLKDDHAAGCGCQSPAGRWSGSADSMTVTFPRPEGQWGTCDKHGAPVPCSDCHALVTRNGGHPLVVRRFTCTTCQLPVKVRQYRDAASYGVAHVDYLLAVCQHSPTAPPEP